MNKQTEALKMAIKALREANIWVDKPNFEGYGKAIQACREALEQPAQKPVAMYENGNVNWINTPKDNSPLYTHPAPSWQGLSDSEITQLKDDWGIDIDHWNDFARDIEQALKEKNHG